MRDWVGLEDGGDEVGGSNRSAARMGAGQQKGWGCAFLSLPHLLPLRLPGLSFQGSPPLMFGRRLQQNPVVSSASGRGSSPSPFLLGPRPLCAVPLFRPWPVTSKSGRLMNPVSLGGRKLGAGREDLRRMEPPPRLLVHSQSEPILISDLPGQLT